MSQSITGSVTALSHSGLDLVNALFVPVTEPSVSGTLETDAGAKIHCMSLKKWQIKISQITHRNKSRALLILSEIKPVSKGRHLSYNLKDPVIVFGRLCTFIYQVYVPDTQASPGAEEAERLSENNIKSKYPPEPPWAL